MLNYFVFLLCFPSIRVPAKEVVVVFQDQANQPVVNLVVRASFPHGILTLTTNEKGEVSFKTRSPLVLFDLAWPDTNDFYSLPETWRLEEDRNLLTIKIQREKIPGSLK